MAVSAGNKPGLPQLNCMAATALKQQLISCQNMLQSFILSGAHPLAPDCNLPDSACQADSPEYLLLGMR